MRRGIFTLAALTVVLAVSGKDARAQWMYPNGYGAYGWGGWGGGHTVAGDEARGLGVYAAGAGVYNQQTAVANSINADTVMRWNEYWYESQQAANRAERERQLRRQANVNTTQDQLLKRLRENPEPRDVYSGSALNVAAEEINNPRVYAKSLSSAKAKIGGETIRDIPFQYAAGAISTSVHSITQGSPPESLMTPVFEPERAALKEIGAKIREQIDETGKPDSATIEQAQAQVKSALEKVEKTYKRNTPQWTSADKYLKSVRGLLRMLDSPAVEVLMAGVEKYPDATLGDLLRFMNAFNLRFGPANTPRQRQVYDAIYPKLDELRDQIDQALAARTGDKKPSPVDVGEFFSGMSHEDIGRKAPAPPAPATNK